MKNLFFLLLLPVFVSASVQYPASTITEQLRENAYAVVRLEKTSFKIIDAGKAVLSKHILVTILNERGAELFSDFETDYDKHTVVKDMKGYIYDQAGNEVFRLKKTDIIDIGMSAFTTDITDSRKRIASFIKKQYAFPYTIDFYDEVETKNMMFYPNSVFIGDEHVSIEEQVMEIIAPLNFEFRYKEVNMPSKVEITSDSKFKKYVWRVQNILADVYEEFLPPGTNPKVYTAPIEFNVENYSGKIQSWNDIGLFYAQLNKDRTQLSEENKAKILQLIAAEKDTFVIINKLYQYLQNNTRYVSIQLGIGGWQTATAQEVASKGYGDCKALSNYFLAILNVAGIKAHTALVKAGSDVEMAETDFPRFSFNHVICCVPYKSDTLWYECTSQNSAPAFLGSFTGNRKALLITENGGVLVNTSNYTALQNSIERYTAVNVNTSSTTLATSKTTYSGIELEDINYIYHNLNQEQQKKYLKSTINLPMSEIASFTISSNFYPKPQFNEELNLSIKSFLNQSGSTYLLAPNIWYKKSEYLTQLKKRNNSFYLSPNSFSSQHIDSIVFNLPSNLAIESLPAPMFIESKFGTYIAYCKFENQVLTYYRKYTVKPGTFEASEYKNWLDFNKAVDKFDRQQVALIKKD